MMLDFGNGSGKNSNERREKCLIFPHSNDIKFGVLTLLIGVVLIMILLCVIAALMIQTGY